MGLGPPRKWWRLTPPWKPRPFEVAVTSTQLALLEDVGADLVAEADLAGSAELGQVAQVGRARGGEMAGGGLVGLLFSP